MIKVAFFALLATIALADPPQSVLREALEKDLVDIRTNGKDFNIRHFLAQVPIRGQGYARFEATKIAGSKFAKSLKIAQDILWNKRKVGVFDFTNIDARMMSTPEIRMEADLTIGSNTTKVIVNGTTEILIILNLNVVSLPPSDKLSGDPILRNIVLKNSKFTVTPAVELPREQQEAIEKGIITTWQDRDQSPLFGSSWMYFGRKTFNRFSLNNTMNLAKLN